MRRYRLDKEGKEQPVWMSQKRMRALGEQEGRAAAREGREPIRFGNRHHDDAARKAYERAKQEG